MEQPEPKTLIERLQSLAGMTQDQIADALTEDGVPVTQATINRIKLGKQRTSYEVGMGLLRLSQSRIKSKRSASALNA
jgi:arginine repressor